MRTLSRALFVATAAALLIPTFASASDDQPTDRTPEVHASATPRPSASPRTDATHPKFDGGQFCNRFTDATGKLSTDTTEKFKQLSDNFGARGDKVRGDFKSLGDRIGDGRTKADAARAKKFAELEAKATTADQKSAVTTFEASINAAVAARRAATDSADATFKAGLLLAVADRQAALKTAATNYKAAVATALANAKASCAAGANSDTVRANLKTALDTARANLDTARKNAPKAGPNVDTLKAAHKTAIDKANADFKAAVKTALATLKAALGVTSSPSPVTTP